MKKKSIELDQPLGVVQKWMDQTPIGEPYPYTAILRVPVRPCPGAVGEFIDCEVEVMLQDVGFNEELGAIESVALNVNLNFK